MTREHTRSSLTRPPSPNPTSSVVPAGVQVAPPSVERSTRNPSSLVELSVQVTPTDVLVHGTASVPEGAFGGMVTAMALALFDREENPPSLFARTLYQYFVLIVTSASW